MVTRLSAVLIMVWFVAAALAADEAKPVAVSAGAYLLDLDLRGGWSLDGDLNEPGQPETLPARLRTPRAARTPDGEAALAVVVDTPRAVGIIRHVGDDREAWGRGRTFSALVYVPEAMGPHPSVQLIAHHGVWGWFACFPTRPLKPGEWTRVYWPLAASSIDWRSLESEMLWNDTLRWNLERVGLRVYTGQSETAAALADEAPAGDAEPLEIRFADLRIEGLDEPTPPLQIVSMQAGDGAPQRGKRFEITMQISRWYENPFDPEQVTVDGEFTAPSGKKFSVPGFYFQDFSRRWLADGSEACDARGLACWKVRYCPTEAGEHAFQIKVKDWRGDTLTTEEQRFTAADAKFRGFVRIDPKDPHFLSFSEDNSFFYPIGMIVRSPWDKREQYEYEFDIVEGRGTYGYDEFFTSMSQTNMNFTRVWMSAWWTALEWSHGYRRDYAGIGRYNQMNAWRMDYVVDLAEKLGIYIDVTLHNHGQFRARDFDSEWYDNAYYSGQGGPVDTPTEFWTDPKAREYLRKRLRYIAGRWGPSPAIGWWELSNEVDLVGDYNSERIASWHKAMGDYMKEVDPYKHITTTHYTYGHYDPDVLGLKEIEIGQSTAYRADMVERCIELYNDHHVLGKPAYVNEFGVGKSHLELRYNLHSGLWASSVMPFCGNALFWWWHYVQQKNEYPQYASLIRFREGEDDRGKDYQITRVRVKILEKDGVVAPTDPLRRVRATGMQNADSARLWIYDPWIYQGGTKRQAATPVPRPLPETQLRLPSLEKGTYRIVFWDTWEGRETSEKTVKHPGGEFVFDAPAFERDIACKIDRVSGEGVASR